MGGLDAWMILVSDSSSSNASYDDLVLDVENRVLLPTATGEGVTGKVGLGATGGVGAGGVGAGGLGGLGGLGGGALGSGRHCL